MREGKGKGLTAQYRELLALRLLLSCARTEAARAMIQGMIDKVKAEI